MTTSWGRALMATPIVGQAVGMFAKGYAGIVASELKKCTPPPAAFPPTVASPPEPGSSCRRPVLPLPAAPAAARATSAPCVCVCLLAKAAALAPRADGLRHEDVMVVTPDVDAALRRMDPYEVDMRNKRLKRAADLSVKHTYLPYELQAKHDPWAESSASLARLLRAPREGDELRLAAAAAATAAAFCLTCAACMLRSHADADRGQEGAPRAAGDWRRQGRDIRLAGVLLQVDDSAFL